ncbi:MAG TPA: ATP-binding cassette domain-containing protein [Kofleriaceae bacterium]|nr:ATP-binding cassette domain-containing protein [Kofleriaceae bacterium]
MEAAIQLDNLQKTFVLTRWRRFRRVRTEVLAVAGITLDVPAGQAVAIIGPNGAGKSTTIKMLTGIVHPSGGHARVRGMVPWLERRRLAGRIGAVFGQRSQLWYHLPPRETFELLARIYGLDRERYRRMRDELVDRFALGAFLDRPVRKLSLGQRMRAEVAASLLHEPEVLFLDEPTIGLDAVARQELRAVVREWNRERGVTLLLTSHDAGDIEHVAKRALVIHQGRVVLDDSVASLRRRYLGSKVLRVRFHEPPAPFHLAGITVVKSAGSALKLHVDTRVVAIERVMTAVLKSGPVADIAIEDPPLDEVIAHIYTRPPPTAEDGAPA